MEKKDTIILSDAVQQMKKEKLDSNEVVDFVYRASHVWSIKFPERAEDCYHDNVEIDIVANKLKFNGLPGFVSICFNLHDTFEDFQFEIHDIVYAGNMKDGKVVFRWTSHGKWVKDGGEKKVDIDGVNFWTMKDGKILKHTTVVNGADPIYNEAMERLSSKQLK